VAHLSERNRADNFESKTSWRVGILTSALLSLIAHRLRFIPRTTRDKTNVNNPTLTSNSTTLGWGTLGGLAGIKDSAHSTRSSGPTRPAGRRIVQSFPGRRNKNRRRLFAAILARSNLAVTGGTLRRPSILFHESSPIPGAKPFPVASSV
jgi:hypothetical protein